MPEVSERTTYLRAQWTRTVAQLETIKRVWASLTPDHQDVQIETLRVVVVKLKPARDNATRSAEGIALLGIAKQVRGALRDDSPQDTHLSLSSSGLDGARTYSVPYSSVWYMERPGKAGFIIDSIHCLPGTYMGDMAKDIRTLAKKLQCADPSTFGLLKCRGVAKIKSSNGSRLESFDVVFGTPTADMPRTLRSCLLAGTPHTLTERMDLAKQLASSVNYVHTLDFVHKNIRPDNMIGFGDTKLGNFFLVDFEQVRSVDGMSYFRGDADWEKNLPLLPP